MHHNFRALEIWKDGIRNSVKTFQICKRFPSSELFGIAAQMKKSSVSIPSNIAEGCGRSTEAQMIYFLDIALGSAFELETQVIIAKELQLIPDDSFEQWENELHSLQKRIKSFRDKLSKG